MNGVERVPVSVVVATYDRPEGCRTAVESALEQRPAPLEVVVCDDGSPRSAARELASWCAGRKGVVYLRLNRNHGRPAPARNAGVSAAGGDWLAFLDDDDRWVPGSLERRWGEARTGRWDVVAGDAERSSGGRYFAADVRPPREPSAADICAANPVILSTALVRRELVRGAGGFDESRLLAGLEDYALWLALADSGARFLVLDEPLAVYDDDAAGRLSAATRRRNAGLAVLTTSRWLRAPGDRARANAAFAAGRLAARSLAGALRRTAT